ncbi:protein kinase [Streptomyces ipomoeae]|uniref:Protein kinase domain-containing protein n=1 Tax=Streptomyces ipomoeae 91-03 TaxID=698759 RepID=L1KTW7_9ACTN|nr:protein kinase [Streptomyces ipomoeae]EKX63813.1 hypothetical protein STRIP9103_06105 [Streptomyces ipomoeae 91-03]
MDEYAGRVLADRYRLPLPPSDEYELADTRAFDTYSGQEVLIRQVPLPEVVEAEVLGADGLPEGYVARDGGARRGAARTTRRPTDPAVLRAVEAAQAAAQIPDHPRLDQVFDVFTEGGSLWIVSELVPARTLETLLEEQPLSPYRAAEVASDVLTALWALHAHGWVHRNITVRTVLVCDDGRVMLTGLAVGAAEEALCGYDPVPVRERDFEGSPGQPGNPGAQGGGPGVSQDAVGPRGGSGAPGGGSGAPGGVVGRGASAAGGVSAGGALAGGALSGGAGGGAFGGGRGGRPGVGGEVEDPEAARRAAIEARAGSAAPVADASGGQRALDAGDDVRAARAGAIAAYRAGARAAARVDVGQGSGPGTALPEQRPAPGADRDGTAPSAPGRAGEPTSGTGAGPVPPGRIADPYGVRTNGGATNTWHGALPRGGTVAPGGNGQGNQGISGNPALPPTDDSGSGIGAHTDNGPQGLTGTGGYSTRNGGSLGDGAQGGGAAGTNSGGPYSVRALGSSNSPYGGGPYGGVRGAGGRADVTFTLDDEHANSTYDTQGAQTPPAHDTQGGQTPPAYGPHTTQAAPARDVHGAQATPAHGTAVTPPGGTHLTPAHGHAVTPTPPHGHIVTPTPPHGTHTTPWDRVVPAGAPPRGPATALAAERARQARMALVGPVTERWAPEQAGPVHENWQLAAPIGPATDLWALGALLFRAVQGHAPYPEENTAELVELVCSEPPAFAEECGPLRPVVESLLRQDPTERLDFEELRGWLRSLVRSAPEPEAGAHVVAAPPVNASRLPIVRRRGELVRRRRAGLPATSAHARHRRARPEKPPRPRSLGRNLLLLVLLALAAAVTYAMVFMPKAEPSSDGGDTGTRTDTAARPSSAPEASSEPRPDQNAGTPDGGEGEASPSESSGSTETQTGNPDVAQGFTLRKDPAGFEVAVANGWDRSPKNGRGQIAYSQGQFELILVPGRDSTQTYGSDPLKYQREDERELQPFRDSTWATSGGMRLIEVGGVTMAEGQFTWQDSEGRGVFVRNLAILVDGRYHVVQLRGPEAERDEVTRLYEQASKTYRVTG